MVVEQRPFRGRDQQIEGQINPLYRQMTQIDSDNARVSAFMPISTMATTGSDRSTHGGNIAWRHVSTTLTAPATAAALLTIFHELGRTPVGLIPCAPLSTTTAVVHAQLFLTRSTDWNTRAMLARVFNTNTATQSFTVSMIVY